MTKTTNWTSKGLHRILSSRLKGMGWLLIASGTYAFFHAIIASPYVPNLPQDDLKPAEEIATAGITEEHELKKPLNPFNLYIVAAAFIIVGSSCIYFSAHSSAVDE